jgi:uncharacterized RDD family membrane protein YckC
LTGTTPESAQDIRYCSECGRPWPADELVRFGDRLVCGDCKNKFAQRLREGAVAGTFVYAGFWIRVVAALIDSVLLLVPMLVLGAVGAAGSLSGDVMTSLAVSLMMNVVGMLLGALYEAFFVARFAATPGKMALRLKVVMPDGGRVSFWRAFGRYFAKLLNMFTLLIGYIMVAFDAQKRGLHDMICGTRVIRAS